MKVALVGSVSSSLTALEALIRGGIDLTGVLGLDESLADKVADYRSLRERSESARIPFQSFVSVQERAVESFIRAHRPDLLWVIGLSQLVPDSLIRLARDGGVGFHPTPLPRGRGRAPVAWTILKNDPAAVSLFFLTEEADAGDIIIQKHVPVLPDDYSEDLIARTNEALAACILQLCPLLRMGALPRTPQDHRKATYYTRRTPADGLIDWSKPTEDIYRLIRAAGRPYAGAFCSLGDHKVIIYRARPASADDLGIADLDYPAGTVIRGEDSRGHLVRTIDGGLWATEVSLDGTTGSRDKLKPGIRLAPGPPVQVKRDSKHVKRPGRRAASRR